MGGRILVIALALLAAVPAPAWALAGGATGSGGGGGGGGFSGGGGGGFSGGYSGGGSSGGRPGSTVAALAIVFGIFALVLVLQFASRRRRRPGFKGTRKAAAQARGRSEKAEDVAHAAQADDAYWAPDELKKRVRECFFPIQQSWENRDVSRVAPVRERCPLQAPPAPARGLETPAPGQPDRRPEARRRRDRPDLQRHRRQQGPVRRLHPVPARDWMEDTEPARWSTATSSRRPPSSSTGPSSATRARLGARRDPAGRGGRLPRQGEGHRHRRRAYRAGGAGVGACGCPPGSRSSCSCSSRPSRPRRGRSPAGPPAAVAAAAAGSRGGGGFSGGSSGGSGGNGKFSALSLVITIGAVAFAFGLAFFVNRAAKRRAQASGGGPQATPQRQLLAARRAKKAEDTAKVAQAGDGYWDPARAQGARARVLLPDADPRGRSATSRTVAALRLRRAVQAPHAAARGPREAAPRQPHQGPPARRRRDRPRLQRDRRRRGPLRGLPRVLARATGWRTPRPGRWSTATRPRRPRSSSTGASSATPSDGWVLDEIQQGSEGEYHVGRDRQRHEGPRSTSERWACSTGRASSAWAFRKLFGAAAPRGARRGRRRGWTRSPSSTTSGRPRRCAAGSATSSSRSSGRGSSATPRSRRRT